MECIILHGRIWRKLQRWFQTVNQVCAWFSCAIELIIAVLNIEVEIGLHFIWRSENILESEI